MLEGHKKAPAIHEAGLMVRFGRQACSLTVTGSAILLAIALAGCASRPGPEALATVAAPTGAKMVKVFVATNRARETPDSNIFTARKAQNLNFAEFTIAIPEDHRAGRIELAGTSAQSRFVVVDQHALIGETFIDRVGRFGGKKRQDVTVFVHGFNNNFQESLFRLAQVSADSGIDTAQILFSWPSHARVAGYVADKESVTYSRDYLAALLAGLARDPRIGRIRLAAHSMGSWLVVETLRELRLAGKDAVVRRIDVVLAAPDIDVEVFAQQLKVIGPLSPPMKILVAKDDRALKVSGFLASSIQRVGALDVEDPRVKEAVLRARVQVIDISELSSSDGLGHDRFVYLAGLYPRLAHRPGLSHAGVFLLDTAGALVTAPVRRHSSGGSGLSCPGFRKAVNFRRFA
jgi:esterase/lipase superfamily enzyme